MPRVSRGQAGSARYLGSRREGNRVKRPTIADIASRAGVTKAAVSFALNDQPGVSAATRQRILAIASEIGFQPSSAARALSDGRAGAFGFVFDRPARMLGIESFLIRLISGIQAELSRDQIALLFTTAEDQSSEIGLYRAWWAQRRVDGVFLVDLQLSDQRVTTLQELGLPAVVFGTPKGTGSLPAIWQDEMAATRTVVAFLAGLGHQRMARVGGIPRYWHTRLRADALEEVARAAGLAAESVEGDYTGEHAAAATRELLRSATPPTAILYDNDLMALAGLSAAQHLGVQVPGELSIVSWDDSVLCELVHPSLTALRRDIAAAGAEGARRLIRLAAGSAVSHFQEPPPVLVRRGSTAAPSRAAATPAPRLHAG
jgi:DNA-binding LacI/PurR family transcriptional regulator